MIPMVLGVPEGEEDNWRKLLSQHVPGGPLVGIALVSRPDKGPFALALTDSGVSIHAVDSEMGWPLQWTYAVIPGTRINDLRKSGATVAINGNALIFDSPESASIAADLISGLFNVSVYAGVPVQPTPSKATKVVSSGPVQTVQSSSVISRIKSMSLEDKLVNFVGVPLFLGVGLWFVGTILFAFLSWVGGLDDDEQTGPSDADTYAYDVTYTPSEIGSATGEARFIDDVAGQGIQPVGSSSFGDLGSAICNDLATSTNDRIVVEATAESIGTTLEKAHYIVLSAQYNVC